MKRAALMLALVATTAHADFMDGNKLLAKIKGDTYEYLQAIGYITGVFDATRGYAHCSPDNVTAGQITDMTKNHLEGLPAARHLPGDQHVVYVLKNAWPCKKGQAL